MNSFEKMIESIYRQHNYDISKHEKIIIKNERAFDKFQISADDFDRKMEKFAGQTEQWLIAQGKKSDSFGIFM
ncbi:hypothetical protein ABES25_06210 [Bacillus gobiensis]|uniref:hypothetical protein n=1 Tax=Bacillus gobiensis TaxID=1441095 RepID=UPI003D1DABCC